MSETRIKIDKNTPPLAIILDVDGVITNPVEKKVTEPMILEYIELFLGDGIPIALNTGRSNEWMIERVIDLLTKGVKKKNVLNNFFAVGEKGLTWASFDTSGQLIQGLFDRQGRTVEGFKLSALLEKETVEHFKELKRKTQQLIAKKYSHSTFYDNTKKAMISTEMKDGHNHAEYAKEQEGFTKDLYAMIKELGLTGKFKVDPTTIATDIQIPQAGKHLGTRRIIDWLTSKNIYPKHFVAVGDSASDLEMADELIHQGKSYEFKYVHPAKPLPESHLRIAKGNSRYNLLVTSANYGKGLIEVFESLRP